MSDVTGQAQAAAGRMRGQVEQAAGRGLGQARVRVRQRSTVAGEQVNTAAQEVRMISAEMRARGRTLPADLADQGADRLNQVGEQLKGLDADQLGAYARRIQPGRALQAVESFGRKRPLAMIAGGLALGFLPSRLLKASSGRRYQGSGQTTPQTGQVPQLGTPQAGTLPDVDVASVNAAGRTVGAPDPGIDPPTRTTFS